MNVGAQELGTPYLRRHVASGNDPELEQADAGLVVGRDGALGTLRDGDYNDAAVARLLQGVEKVGTLRGVTRAVRL